MSTKDPGQVAYEASPDCFLPWAVVPPWEQKDWNKIGVAVLEHFFAERVGLLEQQVQQHIARIKELNPSEFDGEPHFG